MPLKGMMKNSFPTLNFLAILSASRPAEFIRCSYLIVFLKGVNISFAFILNNKFFCPFKNLTPFLFSSSSNLERMILGLTTEVFGLHIALPVVEEICLLIELSF